MTPYQRQQEIVAENIKRSYEQTELIKALEPDLVKGKKANIGEIREWDGIQYKKQGDGSWKPLAVQNQKPKNDLKGLSPLNSVNYKGHKIGLVNSSFGYHLKVDGESAGHLTYDNKYEVIKNGKRYEKQFDSKEQIVDFFLNEVEKR